MPPMSINKSESTSERPSRLLQRKGMAFWQLVITWPDKLTSNTLRIFLGLKLLWLWLNYYPKSKTSKNHQLYLQTRLASTKPMQRQ